MPCNVFGSFGEWGYVGEDTREWPALEKSPDSLKLISF